MDISLDTDYLIQTCAPEIGHSTMKAIIERESANNPWIIHDNTNNNTYLLKTKDKAVSKAHELYRVGNNIDIGLAQINSKNLAGLKLTIEQVIDPCTNLKAGAVILKNFYLEARKRFPDEQQALFHALSAYNTGSFYKGYLYANKVINSNTANPAKNILPTIQPNNAPILVAWDTKSNF